ncbi:MAG: cytochrome c biogenesis protein ResB [Thermodesulfobacteriota bacterium]
MNIEGVRSHPVYRRLADMKTSVYVLIAALFFFLLGTLLPQGADIGDYIDSGGRFALAVRVLGLFGVFTSPAFLLVALVLFACLAICTYEKLRGIGSERPSPRDFHPTMALDLTQEAADAHIDVRRVLRAELGFHVVSKDDHVVVMEKGLPHKWLTIIYHAGFILCFAAFALTFLLAYEDTVTIRPGEPVRLEPEKGGRLLAALGRGGGASGFQIILDGVGTEYAEAPELDYPVDYAARLAMGLGWTRPEYRLAGASVALGDRKGEIRVLESARTVLRETLSAGGSMSYGGYAIRLSDVEQSYRIRVNGSPILLDAEASSEVIIPGLDASLEFGPLTAGTLLRMDGGTENIAPRVRVRKVGLAYGRGGAVDLGWMAPGESLEVDGVRVTLVDYVESGVLGYRFDPGMPLFRWSGIFVLIIMALRFYGSWYRAEYRIDEVDGIPRLSLAVTSTGVLSDKERIAERVRYHLTKDEVELTPVE